MVHGATATLQDTPSPASRQQAARPRAPGARVTLSLTDGVVIENEMITHSADHAPPVSVLMATSMTRLSPGRSSQQPPMYGHAMTMLFASPQALKDVDATAAA